MTNFSQTLFPLEDMSRELAALVTERHDDALEMFECDFECGLVELSERPTFDEHVQELFDAVRRDARDIPLWIEETPLPSAGSQTETLVLQRSRHSAPSCSRHR